MLRRLLDIRPGEGRLVAPVAALGFVVVGAQVLSVIASDTIFVTAFSLGQLSGFIAFASVVRVLFTFGYGGAARRKARRGGVLLALVAAFTAALGVAVRSAPPPIVYGICLGLLLVPVAAAEAVSEATETFPARQGKRLVPLVGACSTLGALVAGASARVLAPRFGAPSLLWVGGALLAVGAGLVVSLRRHEPRSVGAKPAPVRELFTAVRDDWRRMPILRVAAALVLLVGVANSLVDFLFKATLKASFGRDEMAAYVGTVEAFLSASVIVAQLVLTGRLAARLGIRGALQLHPAAIAVAGPAFALAPGVPTATLARLSESFFRFAIVTPMRPLLLAPVEPAARARASLLVRGAAAPLGGVLVGAVLGVFGASGPPSGFLGAVLLGTAVAASFVVSNVGRAHAAALARALGEGRLSFDLPPAAAAALAGGLRRLLHEAIVGGDEKRAEAVLGLAGEGQLDLESLREAAVSPSRDLRAAAARAAIRIAKPGEGERFLALVPPCVDDRLECEILATARRLGAFDRARVEAALARSEGATTKGAAELRAEAQISLAARGDASAMAAVEAGLASLDRTVFAASADAAALLFPALAAPALVRQLVRGPHFVAAARALVQAGEATALAPLLGVLDGERADGGEVRAARVLARLGPHACREALERYASLGHRAREAVASAMGGLPEGWRARVPADAVERAIGVTLDQAEGLVPLLKTAGSGLFARELRLRIARSAGQVLDLAGLLRERARIDKARAGLVREGRARADALELLEHVLPKRFGRRAVALLEIDGRGRPASERDAKLALDPWLETCRGFDRRELVSPEMIALLDKLLVLGASSLFQGMTSEELHPVGEIAEVVDLRPGELAVRQGDPGDAVFVVAEGSLDVKQDGRKLKQIGRNAVFGEMALLDGGPRSASVEAATEARLLRIPRPEFEALIDQHPEIARGIIRTLLAHLRGEA